MHVQHVDPVTVQPAQNLARDDLVRWAARCPPAGDVDDSIHHREQRVHLVRGQQDGNLLLPGYAGQQADDSLAAAQVEVGQWLVEEQQPGARDEGVGDQHALLLAAGQRPDSGVSEPLGIHRVQHLAHGLRSLPRGEPEAEPVAVQPERDQVPGPHRHIRVEHYLLRDVADGLAPQRARLAEDRHRAGARPLQAENDSQQRRLACPVRADQPGELPGLDGEADLVEDLPPAERDADVVDAEYFGRDGDFGRQRGLVLVAHYWLLCHNFCVETLLVTAFSMAWTSASIQLW